MRTLLITCIAILFLSSCSENTTLTPKEVIEKSIKFHDPKNEWWKFNQTLHFESSFKWNDSIPEELMIWIDVLNNDFNYCNLDRMVEVRYNKDSCEVIKGGDICGNYSWTKNFYTYVWGLPMKLKDLGTPLQDSLQTFNYKGKEVYVVKVNYTKENWTYFFDKEDFKLLGFEFLKNDDSKKGEKVYLSDYKKLGNFTLPFKRIWTDYHTGDTLGTNLLIGYFEGKHEL